MNKLSHDATPSASGLIYQFYQAVEWCFDLVEGQSICIEKHGDISCEGQFNIEVKHYKDALTDSHINLWKTLKNWLQAGAKISQSSKLILLTTQEFGAKSKLKDWNNKNTNEKLEILEAIHKHASEEYEKQIQKDPKKNKSQSLLLIESVLAFDQAQLSAVLNRFEVLTAQPMLKEQFNLLVEKCAKAIPPVNKERFIKSLMGFILTPHTIVNNQWEISYADFTDEVEIMSSSLAGRTIEFDAKYTEEDFDETWVAKEELYISKIKTIMYDQALPEAIVNCENAKSLIAEGFHLGERKKKLDKYRVELLSKHKTLFRKAHRNCGSDTILSSQDFYDDCMLNNTADMDGFANPEPWFHRGVLHLEMDDPEKKLKWKLKDD